MFVEKFQAHSKMVNGLQSTAQMILKEIQSAFKEQIKTSLLCVESESWVNQLEAV